MSNLEEVFQFKTSEEIAGILYTRYLQGKPSNLSLEVTIERISKMPQWEALSSAVKLVNEKENGKYIN